MSLLTYLFRYDFRYYFHGWVLGDFLAWLIPIGVVWFLYLLIAEGAEGCMALCQ